MSTIKLTCEQLYDRVWTTPLSQLSELENVVTCFMTDLAGQRPNRLSKIVTHYC
jgi:hypothetical protein